MSNDVFDENAETYSDEIDKALNQYGADHDFFTRHKAWLIEHLVRKQGLDIAKLSLLDVGCGVGKVHEYLDGKFAGISGIDISAASIEVARETYPKIDYQTYDGTRIPYGDGSFDVTLAICVMHHVPPQQWKNFASEMLRVLRPGGFALVIEHNPYNPVTRRIVNNCPLDVDAVLLSGTKLRSLFEESGGRETKTRSTLSIPPVGTALRRADLLFGRLPLGAQYYCISKR